MPSSVCQFSPAASLPRLPIEDFIPDEVYELCDLTPAEMAAVAILKKRGPPPKPPAAYRGSHSTDSSGGDYGVLMSGGEITSEFKSSLESSLRNTLRRLSISEREPRPPALGPKPPPLGPKPPLLGPKPAVRPKPPIKTPKPVRELKPPPRKKHNVLHKQRLNNQLQRDPQ